MNLAQWSADGRLWSLLGAAVGVWVWGAIPVGKWIQKSWILAIVQAARGAVPAVVILSGGAAFLVESGAEEPWAWAASLLCVGGQVSSPFFKTGGERPRGFFISAGALAALAPIAAVAAGVCAAAARQLRGDGLEKQRMEIVGVMSAAVATVITHRPGPSFWIGALWFLFLLQRQSENIAALLEAQRATRGVSR